MPAKRGRKARARTTAEKLLMAEVSEKFTAQKRAKGTKEAAKELRVSPASFYNYVNQDDLPSFEVLKRAHDKWGLNFKHVDFGSRAPVSAPTEEESPRQYLLPFLESVRQNDIEVLRTKPVKPDMLEVTVRIKFAG